MLKKMTTIPVHRRLSEIPNGGLFFYKESLYIKTSTTNGPGIVECVALGSGDVYQLDDYNDVVTQAIISGTVRPETKTTYVTL